MAVQIDTFGGLQACADIGELDWLLTQRTRAALLVYLAVERRVSRESLTAVFWPESDAENARHALRQSLYHLRKTLGSDWIDSRAHELVVSDVVRTDAGDFAQALERGDTESAVHLYRGPFLDGVHLADLQAWESWVDGRRAQYARSFRKACRVLLEAKLAAGDSAGAIEIAERWAARDPSDDEAQHRFIETLGAAGERAEAIRQYETYARMLEPDGLEPSDETRELAERLRSDSAPLPALRVGAAPVDRQAPPDDPVPAAASAIRRRPVRLLLAAVVLLAVLASAWALRLWSARDMTPTSSDAIAVLPFTVRGSEAIQYLGDGAVNLLTAALDGTGSLRPVDTRATFAAVAETGGAVGDPEAADRIAARLGAGMFVSGSVVEAGGQLQLEAAVYRVDPECAPQLLPAATPARCRTLEPAVSAVVIGAADSVFGLVDQLAARLLGGLGDPNADRLLRTASLTTTSLPAFKYYLRGEELMRAGQFERAAEEYLAAIALDSTFAVAHYRLALAREWAPLPGIEVAANAAARHAERLSSRDRALLEALSHWRAGDATKATRTYRTVLAQYPDDVDAWFQLGEIQFHHGPLLGNPLGDSEEAWRRVLSSEPRNLFALTHLARLLVAAGRTAAVDSLLAPFTADELRNDRRLEEILILRAVAAGDTVEARELARVVRQGESLATLRVAGFLTAFSTNPAAMRAVIDELATDYPNPAFRADLHWFGSLLELAGGRLGAAESARARAVEAERALPAGRRRWGFDPVTEWYAATLPLPWADSTLERVRRRAASFVAPPAGGRRPFENALAVGTPIQVEPLRQYTLGLLSLRLGDTASAAEAATSLSRLAASGAANALVRDLDRGLRARLAWTAGAAAEALRLLQEMESRDSQGDIVITPFVARANERYLRGEILDSLGRDEEALRWFGSLGVGSVTEIPLQALSHLRQGEISERLGRSREAARHDARVQELWQNADRGPRELLDSGHRAVR